MQEDSLVKILMMPKWYPGDLDPQNGVFIQKQAKAISEHCKMYVLCLFPDPVLKTSYKIQQHVKDNYREIHIYYKSSSDKIPVFGRLITIYRYVIAYLKGRKMLRLTMGKPDLVHVYILKRTAVWAYLEKIFKGVPYIISEQSSAFITEGYKNQGWIHRVLTSFVVKRAELVIPVSTVLRDAMIERGLMNKFEVIPNIVEFSESKTKGNQAGLNSSDKIKILSVADLRDKVKNISGMINAIEEVVKSHKNIEYHVIGGGEDEKYLHELAESKGLKDKVIFFHGMQPNNYVLDFIPTIDFLVTNSNFETFSVVTAEALGNGKPVITTRCGGPQTFVDETNGILIEPGNQPELVDALKKMIETFKQYDPAYLRNSVVEKFSAETIGKQYFSIYQSIIENKNR